MQNILLWINVLDSYEEIELKLKWVNHEQEPTPARWERYGC